MPRVHRTAGIRTAVARWWVVPAALLFASAAFAGSLTAPAPPDQAGSAMFTLEDLYQRLAAGTAGTKRAGAFTDPTVIGATMHTLDQIMAAAPAAKDAAQDATRAAAADVKRSKTFWSLSSTSWGAQTGTLNSPPTVANAITNRSATQDTAFSYQFPTNTFSDADGDSLTYSALQSTGLALPAWVTFTPATRTFAGTPHNADVGDLYVTLTATDGHGGSVGDLFKITVANVNDAPVVAHSIPNQTATEHAPLSFAVDSDTFSDPDGDSLTWSATLSPSGALPGWLTFTAGSRFFTGTPAEGDVGSITLRVSVSDGHGGSNHDDFTLTVNNVNDPPTAQNGTFCAVKDSSNNDFSATYSDPDSGDTATLHYVSNPTAHGSASIHTGDIRYNPEAGYTGSDTITYIVTDTGGLEDHATVTVNVQNSCP